MIRVVRPFRAPAERVFAAWLDRGGAGRWLFATASRPIEEVAIDPRVGGAFRFVERRSGRHTVYAGRYLEVEPPRRLAFTLANGPRASRVTIDIAQRGAGCALALFHEDVPSDELERTEGRWLGILYGLAVALGEAV